MPVIVGELGSAPSILEKTLGKIEIRGKIETIQTVALLKLVCMLRRTRKIGENLLTHVNSKIRMI